MANDETPKIEPTLVLKDAPSIAADEPRPEPKIEPGELAVVEAPETESKTPDTAQARVEAEVTPPKPEPSRIEAPTLPRAPQLGDTKALVPFKAPASTAESAAPQPRSTRFALLAASVATAKEHVADEVKALKDSVAQLRATTKSLSDNLAALKTTVASSSAQSNKI